MIAYEVNVAGKSQLNLHDVPTGTVRIVALAPGIIRGIEIAP